MNLKSQVNSTGVANDSKERLGFVEFYTVCKLILSNQTLGYSKD